MGHTDHPWYIVPNTMEESIPHGSDSFNFEIYDHICRNETDLLYPHWHHEYEINYVAYGEVEFNLDGASATLTGGQALIVDRYVIHGCQTRRRGDHRYISIVFGENMLFSDTGDLVCQKYFLPMMHSRKRPPALITGEREWEPAALAIIREICDCALIKGPVYELDIRIKLLSLFGLFIKNGALEDAAARNKFADVRIKESISYIHENYEKDIKVTDIAASVNLCPEHFIRSFKALTGKTPKDYLIRHRISRVMARIASGNENMAEIAEKCGFGDACYLSRCFKKHTGMSPQAYRKSLSGIASGDHSGL